VNKPPGLNAFLFPAADPNTLGSVETSPLFKIMRPATFALWFILFAVQALTLVATGEGANWVVIFVSTVLFAGVHLQFWYEESEQGRRFHHALERMRGRIYEDTSTGLPNSRHFVFELRRQMMRSVRNGRGFSLILTDLNGADREKKDDARFLHAVGRSLRHASSDGDFLAHLEGPVFAAIVVDDRERNAAEKADGLLAALGAAIPRERAGSVQPVVSLTGYQGELEVRDFLRRAQRDLLSARSGGSTVVAALPQRPQPAPAARAS